MSAIIPAILSSTKADAVAKLKRAEGVARTVQIDIIDGVFAPNKTILPRDLLGVKTSLKLEWHLMVKHPETYLHDIARIPASSLVIAHIEALKTEKKIHHFLAHARFHHLKAGLAINPRTDIKKLKPCLPLLDEVLVMTVQPGFMGQSFIDGSKKIKQVKKWHATIPVEVDGGIRVGTARICRKAGADVFVSGSALYNTPDFKQAFLALKNDVRSGQQPL